MFSFIPNIINNDDSKDTPVPEDDVLLFDIDTTFQLPIQYLDKDNLFSLSDTISYDLELKIPSNYESTHTMYDYLFNPSHTFAKNMIPLWQQHITNDVLYLNDTKHILTNIQDYKQQIDQYKYEINCDTVKNIWKSIKMDESFLEKYNFIEWEMLKHLNDSPTFLQALSVAHVLSPIISFALPILFLIFPFILLKIQGVPITIDIYVKTLQNVAKNHFIGKAISSFQSLSWDKVVYVLFMLSLIHI